MRIYPFKKKSLDKFMDVLFGFCGVIFILILLVMFIMAMGILSFLANAAGFYYLSYFGCGIFPTLVFLIGYNFGRLK